MTSNTVPVYRHGRKFYVSTEEYERIRSEERRQRLTASQKSQRLPVSKSLQTPISSRSRTLYNPTQRSHSNPSDYRYGILKTPHIPINSLINSTHRRPPTRLSRSTFRQYQNQDDPSYITSTISKQKTSSPTIRSNSSDRILESRRTPLSSDTENEIKRSFSDEIAHLLSPTSSQEWKSTHLRRPVPTTISDYGTSPITTFAMTPNEQSLSETNPSKLTNYFARMTQSSLNPPSKPSSSALSGTGSLFESGVQGSDHVYTVLGSSNHRTGTTSSSLLTRSTPDYTKHEYYSSDLTSGSSFSDENSSSLFTLIQRRNIDKTRSRQPEYLNEIDDDPNQQRDLWTRSTMRSQSSDSMGEKKRVRFADTEGLALETVPDKNRLLTRRQQVKISSDSRKQAQSFHNTFSQSTTKVGRNRLATDV